MIDNLNIIKDYVYILLDAEKTPKLDLQIEMIIDEALAYCYREDVPLEMEKPLADVVVTELNRKGLVSIDGDIQSYSEGDLSVSFGGVASNPSVKYNGKIDAFKLIRGLKCSDKTNAQ